MAFQLPAQRVGPWTRFFARQLDYSIYASLNSLILMVMAYKFNAVEKALSDHILLFLLLTLIFFILMESVLVSVFGTTIGKYIFKITLRKNDGSMLTFSEAIIRSSLVLIFGMGLFIPFVSLITNFLSYKRLVTMGTTVWDAGSYSVTHGEFDVSSIIIAIVLYIFTMSIVSYISTAAEGIAGGLEFKDLIESYRKKIDVDSHGNVIMNSIAYQNHTLIMGIRLLKKSINEINVADYNGTVKNGMINNFCYDSEWRTLIDDNLSIKILITDSSGTAVTDVTISKSDCPSAEMTRGN